MGCDDVYEQAENWTPAQTRKEARHRVMAGFLFLATEGHARALDGRLDWETIQVQNPARCPLAQASRGTYGKGMNLAGRANDEDWAIAHGFVPDRNVRSAFLNAAWVELLKPRVPVAS